MSEHRGSKRRIAATEKQRQALMMRKAGATYETIADHLGYASRTGAFKAVMSALNATIREPANELRELELARLDQYLVSLAKDLQRGDVKAINAALKIGERRAKLLGLDQAVEIKAEAIVKENVDEVLSVLADMLPKDLFHQFLEVISSKYQKQA